MHSQQLGQHSPTPDVKAKFVCFGGVLTLELPFQGLSATSLRKWNYVMNTCMPSKSMLDGPGWAILAIGYEISVLG